MTRTVDRCGADDECDQRARCARLAFAALSTSTITSKTLSRKLKGLRIAYSPGLGYADVDPEIAKLVETAVDTLNDLGAKVEKVDPGFEDPAECFRILWWSGARALLARLPKEKKKLLDPALADVVEQSMSISLDDYLDAVKTRGALGSHMRQFMESYDLLVTPTLPIAAFDAGKLTPDRRRHRKMGELDALYLSLQSHPAAGLERSLRFHEKRVARRPAHRRPDVRRCDRAARLLCL